MILALVCLFVFAACGEPDRSAGPGSQAASTETPSEEPTEATSTETPGEPIEPGRLEAPPPVTIRYFDEAIELDAWTYCYKNGCADGSPPTNPPDVGNPASIIVEFPLSGWSFSAEFRPTGEKCGRVQQTPLEPDGDGRFELEPAGHADTYDVTLFGQGDGDLFVTFRWTTPTDGPLPKPEARLAVLANHDGEPDSYGVELEVTNLERTPEEVSATITVRADNGKTLTFEAKRSPTPCWPEGTVYWDGPDDKGLAAAALGEAPFTYEVELVIDGARHVATATWPADEIAGNEPSVALEFSPDLPALS